MIVNEFDRYSHIEWIASDTETHTYIDGVLVTTDELVELGKTHDLAFFREHAEVKTYAWLVSDGTHFAWFETFDEYTIFCAEHRIDAVWWYNAKFDFSAIDYQLLTNGWRLMNGGRVGAYCYKSLHGSMGQRYSLKLGTPYRTPDRHQSTHATTHYDFCNLFGGGLARVLESFDVRDYDGNIIRKLDMDYQANDITPERIAYMRNDVHGLYHAVRIADEFLQANFGRRIAGTKPDVITAGGLAKKTLLEFMYKTGDDKLNKYRFQCIHCSMSYNVDRFFRRHLLYRGGMTLINPKWAGKVHTRPLYKYDENSMYPAQISKMPDLQRTPFRMTPAEYAENRSRSDLMFILEFSEIVGRLKPNKIPVFYHPVFCDYVGDFEWSADGGTTLFMFADEWNELCKWYDFDDVTIDSVICYHAVKIDGYRDFVEYYYTMKADGKREHNKVKEAFAKLILNSSYGKLAENPLKEVTHRVLDPESEAVRLEHDEDKIDEGCILSVVQGALVTSMGRVSLMQFVRRICRENVRENLVYTDTDSVHALTPFDDCDPYTLGEMKDETDGHPYNFWCYLAPKTYFDGHTSDGKITDVEIHSKGVPTKSVITKMKNGDEWKTPAEVAELFKVGAKFDALAGINIRGGKALIPIQKELCTYTNAAKVMKHNDDGEYLIMEE